MKKTLLIMLVFLLSSCANGRDSEQQKVFTDATVLGSKVVSNHLVGQVIQYERIEYGDKIFELLVTDHVNHNEFDDYVEAAVFILEKCGEGYTLAQILDITDRIPNADEGFHLLDVNFDGHKDILVLNGYSGVRGFTYYTCFLERDGMYERSPSFSEIPNIAIDEENRKILSSGYYGASTYSWKMFQFNGNELMNIASLTVMPDFDSGWDSDMWHYTEEKRINGVMQTVLCFVEYSPNFKLPDMYTDPSGYWALLSSKWFPLDGCYILEKEEPNEANIEKIIYIASDKLKLMPYI
jgi:hypothetical protein